MQIAFDVRPRCTIAGNSKVLLTNVALAIALMCATSALETKGPYSPRLSAMHSGDVSAGK